MLSTSPCERVVERKSKSHVCRKFRVSNFKSYRNSPEVELKPGFNIITGQNNAGKTALLEALTFRFGVSPHRSLRTIPAPGVAPEAASSVRATLVLSGQELLLALNENL